MVYFSSLGGKTLRVASFWHHTKEAPAFGTVQLQVVVLVSTHLMSATGTPPPPAVVSSPTPPAPTPPALQHSIYRKWKRRCSFPAKSLGPISPTFLWRAPGRGVLELPWVH